MKKLLLFFFIPFISFSQNDFREMNWGESSKILKEKYSDITFTKEVTEDFSGYYHSENVGGVDAVVLYLFRNDKLLSAGYNFEFYSYLKDATDRLKDFNKISARLNDKYDMTREDDWINDTHKDNPNNLPHAIAMSFVTLKEIGTNDDTEIVHSLENTEGKIIHSLLYSSSALMKQYQELENDKF